MLKSVRHAAKGGLSYILVAGLIVIFAFFFGVPADSCGSSPNSPVRMASIAGQTVTNKDIGIIYNQLYSSRTAPNEAELERQQALSLKAYLMIELLAHKAREAGLRADPEEFKAYLLDPLRNPEFLGAYGSGGGFDAQYYKNYVENFLLVNRPRYERFKEDEMLARKYVNMVEMQISAIPQEVEQLQKLRDTRIDLEFVRVRPDQVADLIDLSDEQVATYQAQNADAIKKYYDANLADYSQEEEMEVRRIYLERDAAKGAEERLAEVKARLEKGEDFAQVAGEVNDALKDQQGLMAMTPVENMNQSIVEALKGARIGDVREVTTDSALMLVKLLDKKEASRTALADVQDDIARTLLKQKRVDEIIDAMTTKLLATAKAKGSLSDALSDLAANPPEDEQAGVVSSEVWGELTVEDTGEFTLEGQDMASMFGGQLPPGISLGRGAWDNIPRIGQSRALAVAAFSKLDDKQPLADQVFSVGDARYVVSLKSKSSGAKPAAKGEDGDSAKGAGANEDASSDKLTEEVIAQKTQSLLGQWQRLFSRRSQFGPSLTMDYGPWLEQQFTDAVKSGLIKLDERSGGAAVAMINPNTVKITPTTAGASPIELSPIEVESN